MVKLEIFFFEILVSLYGDEFMVFGFSNIVFLYCGLGIICFGMIGVFIKVKIFEFNY